MYPDAASQYHTRPKAKRNIAMLSVDKFPYLQKQARGTEFIPGSNKISDILKCFCSFKIPAITLIWPRLPYKHSVTRSYRCNGGYFSETSLRPRIPPARPRDPVIHKNPKRRRPEVIVVVVLFVFKSETRSSLSAPSHGLMVSAETLLHWRSRQDWSG